MHTSVERQRHLDAYLSHAARACRIGRRYRDRVNPSRFRTLGSQLKVMRINDDPVWRSAIIIYRLVADD